MRCKNIGRCIDAKGKKILICCMYREFKKLGEKSNVPLKEQYSRIEKWLKRLEGLFQTQGEIWMVGDWNADFLKVGDDKY